jgi:hypothetical protein
VFRLCKTFVCLTISTETCLIETAILLYYQPVKCFRELAEDSIGPA